MKNNLDNKFTMSIKSCPNCNDENIEISYNHKLSRFTLTCYNCGSYYKITKEQANIRCPECESKDIRYEEIDTVCGECGLVLASVPPTYVGYDRVVFDWGLKL